MSRYRFISLSCFTALLLNSAHALAVAPLSTEALMNMPLENLLNVQVTSASKYAQKSSEAPAAVEVITADDIRTFGYRTLGEALNGVHGLYTSTDRFYNYLGRHIPLDFNSRMLIMVDGHRMNDNIYDQVDTGQLFMLNMDLVDHIEYIPGPGSSIYGANAMEGVINVISKKGSDINGTQVAGSYGSLVTEQTRATYGKKLSNGADVLVSASGYHSDGVPNLYYPEFDQRIPGNTNPFAGSDGFAHDLDGESTRHLFAKAQYQDFTFTSGYADRHKQVPTDYFPGIFNDSGYFTDDANYYGDLKYNKQLTSKTQLELEGFDQWYSYHAEEPYTPGLTRDTNYDSVYGEWWGGEAKLVTTAFDRQKLVTGVEFQDDQRQHAFNYDLLGSTGNGPTNPYFNSYSTGTRTGIYAQDDISLRSNLVLSAGGRFDQNHMINGIQFNPRLGLIYDPRTDTTLKLLYGSAFRAPNVNERFIITTPGNEKERVKNYQTVAEWRPDPSIKYTGSLFYNNYTQVLEVNDNNNPRTFDNSGRYLSYGYDLEAEKRWASGRSVKFSFNHTLMYDVAHIWAVDAPREIYPNSSSVSRCLTRLCQAGDRECLHRPAPDAAGWHAQCSQLRSG